MTDLLLLSLFVRRLESCPPLQPAPLASSPSAVGTATTPAPGLCGFGAGDPALPEPSTAELEAIEAEWPVIAAEVGLVDAECRHAAQPSAQTRAAVRTAEAAVIRAHLVHAALTRTHPTHAGALR